MRSIMKKESTVILQQIFCVNKLLFYLDKYLRVEFLSHMVGIFLAEYEQIF